jgi:hypothetical protein
MKCETPALPSGLAASRHPPEDHCHEIVVPSVMLPHCLRLLMSRPRREPGTWTPHVNGKSLRHPGQRFAIGDLATELPGACAWPPEKPQGHFEQSSVQLFPAHSIGAHSIGAHSHMCRPARLGACRSKTFPSGTIVRLASRANQAVNSECHPASEGCQHNPTPLTLWSECRLTGRHAAECRDA